MPSCDYCDREFEDEESYLSHLADAHYDDLDRIDKRRVDDHRGEKGASTRVLAIAGAAILLLVVAGGAFALLSGGGGDDPTSSGEFSVEQQPFDLNAVHTHGTVTVRIDGREFDFGRSQFQLQDDFFHFEGGNGDRWHVHARGVTAQYAMATLGIGVEENRVIHEGQTYNRSDPGVSMTITVNGQPVDPASYVLQDGDGLRIIVDTSDGG